MGEIKFQGIIKLKYVLKFELFKSFIKKLRHDIIIKVKNKNFSNFFPNKCFKSFLNNSKISNNLNLDLSYCNLGKDIVKILSNSISN